MDTQKVGTIVQRISSAYSKGVQSDESRLTPRHIYSVLISNRSTILEQQAKKKQKINQMNYQTITIKMVEHDDFSIDGKNVPSKSSRYISEKPLPRIISNMDKLMIQSVSSIDYSVVFSETTNYKMKYSKGNRFAKSSLKYSIENNHVVIECSNYTPKYLKITALFEDPIEAEKADINFKDYCKPAFDFNFNMDKGIETTVVEMSANELIIQFNNSMEDVTNNSKDSIIDTSK